MIDRQLEIPERVLTAVLDANRRKFSEWSSSPPSRKLRLPEEDLGILIPPRLLEVAENPGKVEAVKLDHWVGRLDQEFKPALHVLIVERGAGDTLDTGESWNETIADTKEIAVSEGRLESDDRPLLFLMADDGWTPNGVKVLSFIVNSAYRGTGIGSQFYERFEAIVSKMGYSFIFGDNELGNIGFFLGIGRYRANELNQELETSRSLVPQYKRAEFTTVKFFNPGLERQMVDPKFLKIPAHD